MIDLTKTLNTVQFIYLKKVKDRKQKSFEKLFLEWIKPHIKTYLKVHFNKDLCSKVIVLKRERKLLKRDTKKKVSVKLLNHPTVEITPKYFLITELTF